MCKDTHLALHNTSKSISFYKLTNHINIQSRPNTFKILNDDMVEKFTLKDDDAIWKLLEWFELHPVLVDLSFGRPQD